MLRSTETHVTSPDLELSTLSEQDSQRMTDHSVIPFICLGFYKQKSH
jgi:hypothetical protein